MYREKMGLLALVGVILTSIQLLLSWVLNAPVVPTTIALFLVAFVIGLSIGRHGHARGLTGERLVVTMSGLGLYALGVTALSTRSIWAPGLEKLLITAFLGIVVGIMFFTEWWPGPRGKTPGP